MARITLYASDYTKIQWGRLNARLERAWACDLPFLIADETDEGRIVLIFPDDETAMQFVLTYL